MPPEMPKSLLVMGSGAIGIEFASFYRTMGVEVTVVELLPQVMPVEDAEISAFAKKQFEKQGMKIILDAKVTKVEKAANSITAHVEMKDGKVEKITADRLISAVGVQGNVENLGLEELGVKTDRGTIRHRRLRQDQRAGHLRHRRRRRAADAGAQGRARGGDLRRKDRRPCPTCIRWTS